MLAKFSEKRIQPRISFFRSVEPLVLAYRRHRKRTWSAVLRFVGQPLNGVLLALLSLTLAYHSYLGVQVVIEDYVHTPGSKVVSLLLSRFAHIVVAVALAGLTLGAVK